MGSRRKSREYLLQMLFQCDMGKQSAEQVQRSFWQQREGVEAEARGYADDLFRAATQRAAEIDALIQAHAAHWKLERMAAVDRNILRAAVTEFLAVPETPRPIIINEALEIARGKDPDIAEVFNLEASVSVASQLRRLGLAFDA